MSYNFKKGTQTRGCIAQRSNLSIPHNLSRIMILQKVHTLMFRAKQKKSDGWKFLQNRRDWLELSESKNSLEQLTIIGSSCPS